jgi:hypothetical protein
MLKWREIEKEEVNTKHRGENNPRISKMTLSLR